MRREAQRQCHRQNASLLSDGNVPGSHAWGGICTCSSCWLCSVSGQCRGRRWCWISVCKAKSHQVSDLECHRAERAVAVTRALQSRSSVLFPLDGVGQGRCPHGYLKIERSESSFRSGVWEGQCIYRQALDFLYMGDTDSITQWVRFQISSNWFLKFVHVMSMYDVCVVCVWIWCMCRGMWCAVCVCVCVAQRLVLLSRGFKPWCFLFTLSCLLS